MERLEVGSVVELSALDCRAWSPSHFTLVYSGIPYNLSPDVTSQINVQTEQEIALSSAEAEVYAMMEAVKEESRLWRNSKKTILWW